MAMKKPYFPLFVDLSEKKVYVIGAGTIAKRRIRSLIDFTDHLTVVAPENRNHIFPYRYIHSPEYSLRYNIHKYHYSAYGHSLPQ